MTYLGVFSTLVVVERAVETAQERAGRAMSKEMRNMFFDGVPKLDKEAVQAMEGMMEMKLMEEAALKGLKEFVKFVKAMGINFIKMDEVGIQEPGKN